MLQCPSLPTMQHAVTWDNGTEYMARARYECDYGYTFGVSGAGDNWRTLGCLASRVWGVVDPEAASGQSVPQGCQRKLVSQSINQSYFEPSINLSIALINHSYTTSQSIAVSSKQSITQSINQLLNHNYGA